MDLVIRPIRQYIVNSYIVRHEGVILVDTGMRNNADNVFRAAAAMGIRPEDFGLIVLTHGHWDHAGAAAEIAARTGAPVAMHNADAFRVEQGVEVPAVPANALGRMMTLPFNNAVGRFVVGAQVEPFVAGVPVGDDGLSLAPYGIPGRIVHTPGHTAGSVSVLLEDGEALVGCMAMNGLPSLSLRPSLPIIAEDMGTIIIGWRKLLSMGVRVAYPGHGDPFPAVAMRKLVGA